MSFSNKVVLVTGAGSGLGEATAMAFVKEDARVVMVDKDETRLKNVAEKCKLLGHHIPLTIPGDVTVESNVREIMKTTIKIYQRLDVLVNCAGIFLPSNIFSDDLLEKYDKLMGVNLRGLVHLTHLAVPYLKESKGNIINISSVVVPAIPGAQSFLCYGMSKAALNYFSIDLAKELGKYGIRVNVVSPGPVRTNIMSHLGTSGSKEWFDQMKSMAPTGRLSEPEDIAEVILFIVKSKGIHGSNYECDNGVKLVI